MSEINFGGVTIPSQQTLSPAGFEQIAFRPACDQLTPIDINGRIFWSLTMSDGDRVELAAYGRMPIQEAYFWLDADGLCKIGGVDVPLVYTDQVPQRAVATVTTIPTMGGDISQAGQNVQTVTPQQPDSSSMPMWAMGAGGLLLLGIIAFLFKATQGDNRKASPKTQQKAKPAADAAATLANLFGGNDDA